MPVDFTNFQPSHADPPTDPRDVFASLGGRAPGFGYLRDVQGQVLDAWHSRRTERDIAIKMNTGTGKTAVGLLALRCSINEGVGPGLYVTPDKFLAEQAAAQAESLGMGWTDDPDSAPYLSGDAIGIVNVFKLMNGLSVFGGPASPRVEPVPIGSLVIDDAHACVRTVVDQSTVRIPWDHEAYDEFLELFRRDLRKQASAQLADLEDRVRGIVVRVPIEAWAERSDAVVDLLLQQRDDESLKFSSPFVRDILPACQAIFSDKVLEIQPLCPPTNRIVAFEAAARRLYLTATLADDSVLVTHFGASESAAKTPISPSSAADIGDRLILSPQELNPHAQEESIRGAVISLAQHHNVVVLVPSHRRATVWEDDANMILDAEQIASGIASLRSGHIGLVVLVNKYDGVDLPDDACRVLVIDSLPEAMGNAERREAELLGGSDVIATRKLQRIEQGMGRGVRSAEDYCVVLLLGKSLSAVLSRPQMREKLGSATQAQLELSMAIAQQVGPGPDELIGVINQCLDRDDGWLSASRQCLTGLAYKPGSIEPFAPAVREAFDAATTGQFEAACSAMSNAMNLASDSKAQGWLQEQLAAYTQYVDPAKAQQVLAGAIKKNPRVLRPQIGTPYRKASVTINQSQTAQLTLAKDFANGIELELGIGGIVDRLEFHSDSAADFEGAIEEIGRLLGFESHRPERDSGSGPDVLWGVGELRYLVIECKSDADSHVWKKDAAQLSHSINWFAEKYDASCTAIPVLVHHSGSHADDAVSHPETRILDASHLKVLRSSLTQYATSLASRWPVDSTAVDELLRHHKLTAGEFVDRYTTTPK